MCVMHTAIGIFVLPVHIFHFPLSSKAADKNKTAFVETKNIASKHHSFGSFTVNDSSLLTVSALSSFICSQKVHNEKIFFMSNNKSNF